MKRYFIFYKLIKINFLKFFKNFRNYINIREREESTPGREILRELIITNTSSYCWACSGFAIEEYQFSYL